MEASHMLAECNQKQRKRTKEVVLCKYEYRWAMALYSLLVLQSCCQFFGCVSHCVLLGRSVVYSPAPRLKNLEP